MYSSPAVHHDGIHCPWTARGRRLAVAILKSCINNLLSGEIVVLNLKQLPMYSQTTILHRASYKQILHPQVTCLQMACVPVTISHTSASHSSIHHYLCCISCTKQPRELSTSEGFAHPLSYNMILHSDHDSFQNQKSANQNRKENIARYHDHLSTHM